MGRGVQTEPLVPPVVLAEAFEVRDGALVHRATKRADLVGEPAGFEVRGRPVVCVQHNGKTRRVGLMRAAWVVTHGAYPLGAVRARDNDPWHCAASNLMLVKFASHQPQSRAGQASSLVRRQEADRVLLHAMADNEGASLAQLSRFAGISEARTSTRLSKLAERGLTQSPMCVPGRSWCLTDAGIEIATGRPLLDDLDRQVLAALAVTPMGILKLSRRIGSCELTAKRRINLLAHRGLVFVDPRHFFSLTPAGFVALGDEAPKRWVKPEAISAAAAKDVVNRTYVDDSTAAQRSERGQLARAAAKRNGVQFNPFAEFDRMAG